MDKTLRETWNLLFSSSPPPWLVENAAMLSGTFDDFATRLRSENGIQITAKEFNVSFQLSDEWKNRQALPIVFKFHDEDDASAEIPVDDLTWRKI